MLQITYQKRDGCIFQRHRKTMIPYKIGDNTSMNWKVLNIEYEYNNKYYSEQEYYSLIKKEKQDSIKKRETIKLCINEFKKFMYYIVAAMLVNLLKLMVGI